ncbi:MAG: hypothetical protein AMXMBFR49_18500 [Chlorobiota bacterium]
MPRPVSILFFVPHPVFNQFEIEEFSGFDKPRTSFMYRNLLLNQLEVVHQWGRHQKCILLLHQFDIGAEGLDELQRFEEAEVVFYEEGNQGHILDEIGEEALHEQELLIIVNPAVMGLTANDYDDLLNFTDQEDEVAFIARSSNGWVSSVSFNYNETAQKNVICGIGDPWVKVLRSVSMLEARPLITTSGLVVRGKKDFRSLYDFLSSKESIPACSFEMHDRFTELFVEYKELL